MLSNLKQWHEERRYERLDPFQRLCVVMNAKFTLEPQEWIYEEWSTNTDTKAKYGIKRTEAMGFERCFAYHKPSRTTFIVVDTIFHGMSIVLNDEHIDGREAKIFRKSIERAVKNDLKHRAGVAAAKRHIEADRLLTAVCARLIEEGY